MVRIKRCIFIDRYVPIVKVFQTLTPIANSTIKTHRESI